MKKITHKAIQENDIFFTLSIAGKCIKTKILFVIQVKSLLLPPWPSPKEESVSNYFRTRMAKI